MTGKESYQRSARAGPGGDESVVYIGLGTNQGDRRAQLREGVRRMADGVAVDRLSAVYETEAAYVRDQPRYLNMALQGRTRLDPLGLLSFLKQLERDLGRAPGTRWGPRPIDLDILLFADRQVDVPGLRIPHPRLHERPFVLQPLAELAAELVPPGLGVPIAELARRAPPIGEIVACLGPLDAA